MKNYIYYIIGAIAAYLLFFRQKASTPAPAPEPSPTPQPTPQPVPQPAPAPPNEGTHVMPGFPGGCPYTDWTACEKWKLEQEQEQIDFGISGPGDTTPPMAPLPQKPPIAEQKPPIAEQKPPIAEQKPPIQQQKPPVSISPRIPSESEIANKAAAERAQQERQKAEAWQRELEEQQKKAKAAGKSTLIREELSPKTAVALKTTLKENAWNRIGY